MNPLPMLMADLRASRFIAGFIIVLVALSVAFGVLIGAQERALRKAATQLADDFDVLVAAPGSPGQVVLTGIYLQPAALPLMEGGLLKQLAADRRVKALAPLAMGDNYRSFPIIGTASGFVTRWGRLALVEGRNFTSPWEAVIGSDVDLRIGDSVTPSHGAGTAQHHDEGEGDPHRHEGIHFDVVGRLPPTHSPWDRAILVPMAGFWATHELGPAAASSRPAFHQRDPAFEQWRDAPSLPGVPLIVVKPNSIADAYGLRSAYREKGTMALFPAEVLTELYAITGNVRNVLLGGAFINTTLVMMAIVLLLWAMAVQRRQRYAILRALGAPRLYVFAVIWLGAVVLLIAGAALGLLLGWAASLLLASVIARITGVTAPFIFALSDIGFVAAIALVASLLALASGAWVYRARLMHDLR